MIDVLDADLQTLLERCLDSAETLPLVRRDCANRLLGLAPVWGEQERLGVVRTLLNDDSSLMRSLAAEHLFENTVPRGKSEALFLHHLPVENDLFAYACCLHQVSMVGGEEMLRFLRDHQLPWPDDAPTRPGPLSDVAARTRGLIERSPPHVSRFHSAPPHPQPSSVPAFSQGFHQSPILSSTGR